MRNTIRKRIAALICSVALLIGTWIPVSADNGPAVTVNSVTAAPGGTVTVTVSGSDFESVTSLGIWLTYDTNALSVSSVSAKGNMSIESVKKNTPGFVQYSGISMDGLSGNNALFTITFSVSETAAEQEYSLPVLITEATSLVNGVDEGIDISAAAGNITVKKSTVAPTLNFYSYLSQNTIDSGEDVELKILCNNPNGLAAGQFSFSYDSDLFTYKSLELLQPMTKKEYVSSINTTNPGRVVLAYSSEEAISSGYLMTLTLTAKENAFGTSTIDFLPLTLMDEDGGNLLYSASTSKSVSVTKKDVSPEYPKVWLNTSEGLTTDKSFVVDVYVEGSSGLAAGDFAIVYDSDALICEGVSTEQTEDGENITVVIDDNYGNGSVNFSMLYGPGLSSDTKLVSIVFRAKDNLLTESTISSAVSDPKDKNVHSVQLDCGDLDVKIEVPNFTVKFIDWDNTILSTQTVPYLSSAIAPKTPSRDATTENHYIFDKWSADFNSVESDLTIVAEYITEKHTYDAVVTAPNCTENGYTTYTCSVCGEGYVDDEVDALGHTEGAPATEKEVANSCTNSGSYDTVVYCTVCDAELSRGTTVVPAKGHDEISHDAKAPTCTEIGWDAYVTCSRCDYTTYIEKSALGHTDGEPVIENEVANSCTADGSYDTVVYCIVCDAELSRVPSVVPAKGHDEIGHEAKAPTCTAIGWDAYVTCSRCDYTTYVEKSALGHDEINHEAKAPTCTEIGWDAYVTCSRCDYTTYVEKSALGHDEINHEAKAPTCTEIGWDAYVTCSRCDYTTYVEKPKLGHTDGEPVIENEVANSCTADGSYDTVVYCTVCDAELSRIPSAVSAKGHEEIDHEAKAPTCTEIGWDAYVTCSRCDYTTYVEKSALGHDEINHEAKAPTCTEIGWDEYVTCSRCDYTTYVEKPKLGHTDGEPVIENEVANSCTADGSYDTVIYCSACDTELSRKTTTVSAAGHSWVNGYCSHCKYNAMKSVLEGNKLTLTLPGFSASSYVVVSWYDDYGRMIDSYVTEITSDTLVVNLAMETMPAKLYFSCFDSNNHVLTEWNPVSLPALI